MKTLCFTAALGLSLCLAGCFTVDSAKLKNGSEHVVMANYGWKFFNWIPLLSGNASVGGSGCAFFRDDVTMEKMQTRFAAYAKGRNVECPVYDTNDSPFLYVFGIPIPYIITYKELTISGTMK